MSSHNDTLSIGALKAASPRVTRFEPVVSNDPVIHPEAAAAARARIAAIKTPEPFIHPDAVPAAPTADLITNKVALAHHSKGPEVSRSYHIPAIVRPMLTAVGIFALTLLLFKSPILISELQYDFGHKPAAPQASTLPVAGATAVSAQDTITIPKINVQAPVEYMTSTNEADIETALESGVIHYASTAYPGQNGNVAIFGHSSNDWWQPGNYKFVFVLLDKLSPGDLVYLDYNSVRYTYQVTGSQVVAPTDMAVLNPTPAPTLSLITCSPPGTSLERLVVTAKQVSPSPSAAQTVSPSPVPTGQGTLPSAAPGFLTQVNNALNSIFQSVASLFGGASTPASAPATTSGGTTPSQLPAAQ